MNENHNAVLVANRNQLNENHNAVLVANRNQLNDQYGNHNAVLVDDRKQMNAENPDGPRKNDWNIIRGHSWSDALYDIAVKYNQRHKGSTNILTRKQKELFLRRMKYYSINVKNELVLVDYNIPPYVPDNINYNGPIPVVYKVVKNSQIEPVLQSFIDRPELHAISAAALYDKVIRFNLLGISRAVVDNFLKGQHLIRKVKKAPYVPIIQSFRPTFPFEYWQMDFIVYNKDGKVVDQQNKGYNNILVIIDIFSKFVYLYPTKQRSASWVSNVLRKIFLSGDCPHKLGSDNEDSFKSNEVRELLDHFGVKPIYGKPYSPQTQGFVENKNKQIKNSIHMYMTKYGDDVFYNILDSIAFSINTTRSSVTKLTPFEVHRGRTVNITGYVQETDDERLLRIQDEKEHKNKFKHGEKADKEIQKMYTSMQKELDNKRVEMVRRRIHESANKREEKMKEKTEEFNVGDFVHIATWVQRDKDKIQMNQLRLHKQKFNGEIEILKLTNPIYKFKLADPVLEKKQREDITGIAAYSKSMFKKSLLVTKKWEWTGFPTERDKQTGQRFKQDAGSLFLILKKHIDQDRINYTVVYPQPHTDHRWTVFRQINSLENKWDSKFHASHLFKATQKNIDDYYTNRRTKRPDFGFIPLNIYNVPKVDVDPKKAKQQAVNPKKAKQQQPAAKEAKERSTIVTKQKVQSLLSLDNNEDFKDYKKRVHNALLLGGLQSFRMSDIRKHMEKPIPQIEYWNEYIEETTKHSKKYLDKQIAYVLSLKYKNKELKSDPEQRKDQLQKFNLYFPNEENEKERIVEYQLDPYKYLESDEDMKMKQEGSWRFISVNKWW